MRALASGREDAIGPIYSRYAPIVFGMASQALDRPTAEEIVQDVFVAVWKNAASFDPARGPVRPWLLQIAHYRIANELRSRSRRPKAEADPEGERLAGLPDPAPDQMEITWTEYRRAALRRALEELPPPQRQALGLAFFEDLSHGEIASVLELPLGTAKSRVRAGLARAARKARAARGDARVPGRPCRRRLRSLEPPPRARNRRARAHDAHFERRAGPSAHRHARRPAGDAWRLPLPPRRHDGCHHVLELLAGAAGPLLPGLGPLRWPLDLARPRSPRRLRQGPPDRRRALVQGHGPRPCRSPSSRNPEASRLPAPPSSPGASRN